MCIINYNCERYSILIQDKNSFYVYVSEMSFPEDEKFFTAIFSNILPEEIEEKIKNVKNDRIVFDNKKENLLEKLKIKLEKILNIKVIVHNPIKCEIMLD